MLDFIKGYQSKGSKKQCFNVVFLFVKIFRNHESFSLQLANMPRFVSTYDINGH